MKESSTESCSFYKTSKIAVIYHYQEYTYVQNVRTLSDSSSSCMFSSISNAFFSSSSDSTYIKESAVVTHSVIHNQILVQ